MKTISDNLVFFITGCIYIAILYVLVRPNSPGAAAVKTVSDALVTVVKNASGYTSPPSGGNG